MLELVTEAVKSVPDYFSNLFALCLGPKKFLRKKVFIAEQHRAEAVKDAYIFLGYSTVFSIAIILIISPLAKSWATIAAGTVFQVVFIFLIVLVLVLSWRLVRCEMPLRRLLIAFCYHFGLWELIFNLIIVCGYAIAHAADPTSDATLRSVLTLEGVKLAMQLPLTRYGVLLGSYAVAQLAGYGWTAVVWPAYRDLAETSDRRSVKAFVLFLVFSLMLQILSYFFGPILRIFLGEG